LAPARARYRDGSIAPGVAHGHVDAAQGIARSDADTARRGDFTNGAAAGGPQGIQEEALNNVGTCHRCQSLPNACSTANAARRAAIALGARRTGSPTT